MGTVKNLQSDLEDAIQAVVDIGGVTAAEAIIQGVLGPSESDQEDPAIDSGGAAADNAHVVDVVFEDRLSGIIADAHIPDGYEVDQASLKHISESKDGTVTATPVSAPVLVTELARRWDGGAWCKKVVFLDPDGRLRVHLVSQRALMNGWNSVVADLAADGLVIASDGKARARLRAFLMAANPMKRVTLVDSTGWHGDKVFMVGAEAVGDTGAEAVCLAPGADVNPLLRRDGTYGAWREAMALMRGNSRLLLAVSIAFAGPLLRMTGAEQGGFHFFGKSSTGKSTTLYAAGSVWGGGKPTAFVRQWSMTATALEATLAQHNDLLVALDEIHRANPKDIGPMIYSAGNGIGKARGQGNGSLRQSNEWQAMMASCGERSAADVIRDAGYKVNAGQEVRLCDIPADAEAGLGVFQDIHGQPDAAKFAEHIKRVAIKNYGWAGPMFVEKAIAHRDAVVDYVEETLEAFFTEVVPPDADGQVRRVANRFALVAAAGELATCWGIVPWEPNDALHAAQECFEFWLERRGGIGAAEDIRCVEQVLATLDSDGMRLFAPWKKPKAKEQFGWRKQVADGEWEFYATTEGFNNLIGQHDKKAMVNALKEKGVLLPVSDDHADKVYNIGGKATRLTRLRLVEAVE